MNHNASNNLNKDPDIARERGKLGGRPKGAMSWGTILNKILDQKMTIEEAGKVKKITKRSAMVLELAAMAMNENLKPAERLKAMEIILDRTEGKAVQKTENLNTELPPTPEQLESRIVEIAEREGLTLAEFKRREGLN